MNRTKHIKERKIPISRWMMWSVILIAMLVLNYWYLNKYLSFNAAYITEFTAPEDSLAEYRNPALASIFYENTKKIPAQKAPQGYFNFNKEYKPKIVILPFIDKLATAAALGKIYNLLQKSAAEITSIIVLSPDVGEQHEKIFVPEQNKLVVGPVDIKINKEETESLKSRNSLVTSKIFNPNKNKIYEQIPFIKKAFPKAKIIPLEYGNINPNQLLKKLKHELKKNDTLMLVLADLSCEKENHALEHQKIDKCGTIGINMVLSISKQLNYHTQVFDLMQRGENSFDYERWMLYPDADENRPLKKLTQELKNIKEFIASYRSSLWMIVQTAFDKAISGNREFSPSRRSFPEEVFDRGASYVYVLRDGKPIGESGNILPNTSVAQSIADNTYAAVKEAKLSPDNATGISLKIYLLSSFEEIPYKSELDLIKKIKKRTDGLIMQDGNRQGVFLPLMWKEAADEKEFLKKLKIKTGLNPNYWNNRIKIYRFRTVEVKNEN